MEEFDYCAFIKGVVKNPTATVRITIKQYYGLAWHIALCQECEDAAARVVERFDEMDHHGPIGFNPN